MIRFHYELNQLKELLMALLLEAPDVACDQATCAMLKDRMGELKDERTQGPKGRPLTYDYCIQDEGTLVLDSLCSQYNLQDAERMGLVLCAAGEFDLEVGILCDLFHGSDGRKRPSRLLLHQLYGASLKGASPKKVDALHFASHYIFATDGMAYSQLCIASENPSHQAICESEIQIKGRVVHGLTGLNRLDHLLEFCTTFVPATAKVPDLLWQGDFQEQLNPLKAALTHSSPLFMNVYGPQGGGKYNQIAHWLLKRKQNFLVVDLQKLVRAEGTLEVMLQQLIIEGQLLNCQLVLVACDVLVGTDAQALKIKILSALGSKLAPRLQIWISRYSLSKDDALRAHLDRFVGLNKIDECTGAAVWRHYAQERGFHQLDYQELANKYRLSIGHILKVVASLEGHGHPLPLHLQIKERVYQLMDRDFGALLELVDARYTLEDLILPGKSKYHVVRMIEQVRHQHTVLREWDFAKKYPYGRGVTVLFSGLPGTGKTMGAQVVASALDMALYRVDLSQVVSKYIGETEKHLSRIFDDTKDMPLVLFFDEADALFGKRTEAKGANDRFLNMEIAFLLQKIEQYEGIVILASNYLKNIDAAFLRRFRFVIDFPLPGAKERLAMWQAVFPASAPCDGGIDFEFLAETFEFTGANIKNVALNAAYIAAKNKEPILMETLVFASKEELEKIGKSFVTDTLGPYKPMLSAMALKEYL